MRLYPRTLAVLGIAAPTRTRAGVIDRVAARIRPLVPRRHGRSARAVRTGAGRSHKRATAGRGEVRVVSTTLPRPSLQRIAQQQPKDRIVVFGSFLTGGGRSCARQDPTEAGSPGSEMPWPFSRSEPESTGNDAGDGNGRRAGGEGTRPPNCDRGRGRRLIGRCCAAYGGGDRAAVLLLDTWAPATRSARDISITIASPPHGRRASQPRRRWPIDEKIAEPAAGAQRTPPSDPPAESPRPSPLPATAAAPQPVAQDEPQSTAAGPPVAGGTGVGEVRSAGGRLSTSAAAKDLVARLKKGASAPTSKRLSTADSTLHRVRVGRLPAARRPSARAEKMKARRPQGRP